MFHFSHIPYKKLKNKRQTVDVEFLIKKKITSLIAACSFLIYVRSLFAGTYYIIQSRYPKMQ